MNITKSIVAGVSASMLTASPIVAQVDRVATPTEESEEMFGGSFLVTALIVAAIVVGVVVFADDDEPVSP